MYFSDSWSFLLELEGDSDWSALAAYMRKTARRVWRDWKDNDE